MTRGAIAGVVAIAARSEAKGLGAGAGVSAIFITARSIAAAYSTASGTFQRLQGAIASVVFRGRASRAQFGGRASGATFIGRASKTDFDRQ
jgi:hypothetical protein